jgi:alpha-ribazole phosphatase
VNAGDFIDIDLLRHGEVEGGARYRGRTDDPLSPAGWQQMWAAVEPGAPWQAIVTSPLVRCSEFSRTFAQRRSLPLRVDERLQEMGFGDWENRSAAELLETDAETLTRFWQDPVNNCAPNGEHLHDVQARVMAGWREIVAQRATTLLVAHGGPIRIILGHCLGYPLERLMEIEVPHATLHRVRVYADGRCEARMCAS